MRIAICVVLGLLTAACAQAPARPGAVAAPGAPAAKLHTVTSGVKVECMQRRMTQNLIRNRFQIVTDVPGQTLADKNSTRALLTVSQEGPNVRVLFDLYVIGKDGSVAPMAAEEATPAAWNNLRKAVDSVADICRGQSPAGSDTFSVEDFRK